MSNLVEAQDQLARARYLLDAIHMAAQNLSREECGAIACVADEAVDKVNRAIALIKGEKAA